MGLVSNNPHPWLQISLLGRTRFYFRFPTKSFSQSTPVSDEISGHTHKKRIQKFNFKNTKYWSLRAIICRQDKYQDPDWKWHTGHTGCNAHSKPCLHTTLSTLDIAHCMSNTTHCTVCYAQSTKRMIPPKQLTSDTCTGKAHIEFKSFTSVVFFATFGPGCTCCV